MAVDLQEARSVASNVDLERGVVRRRIFADQAVYEMEVEQIFARCWLYLAHESQLPRAGDYVAANMGEEHVLVTRDGAGKIHAFINSCRHRGNRVCRADQGHATSFVCPYHGWTYDNTGRLAGVPGFKDLYHEELDRANWGLARVAQVASYKGLIFGTFDPEAPTLDDYLGDMRWGLDLLLDQGEMVAIPGIQRWTMECNWKLPPTTRSGTCTTAASRTARRCWRATPARRESTPPRSPRGSSGPGSLWSPRTGTASTPTSSIRRASTRAAHSPTGAATPRCRSASGRCA
jgi:nitrite reductase/ring-hydroxylating ferredoxin subunit